MGSGVTGELHIASLLTHVRPSDCAKAAEAISALDGAEIHAVSDCGKIVIVLETPDEAQILECIEQINRITGVLLTNLVYHHSENETSLEEEITDEDHTS